MKVFLTMVLAALAAVCPPGAPGATPQALSAQIIRFDDLTPTGFVLKQSWNALGMDANERIYIGFTSLRPDQREDFLIFRYDPANGQRRFLGSFIDGSERAGNLMPGEEIPKGHTRMIEVDGQVYMGSQGFHDFKGSIDALPSYRGAHLYAYDVTKQRLGDLAPRYASGVIVPQQGIIALSVVPERNLLVGLTHPLGDIVLFDVKSGGIKTSPGIPWTLGSPISREIVVARTGMIYVSRGSEEPALRDKNHAIWAFNPSTESLARTPFTFTGGFWNGQTATRDGRFTYISTVHGELYRLETDRGTFTHLGHFLPQRDQEAGVRVNWLYGITLSDDEQRIYGIPQTNQDTKSVLYVYDIATGQVSPVGAVEPGIHTGSHIRDTRGNIYVARFGNGQTWEGQTGLLMIPDPLINNSKQ